uniref:Uncharacterized protein n=1 Tax=Picea glauca TaxID=3330 RepID=A0A101M5B5_PICGL|nr:hypothetical protein ABT39_MTgene951 [Picea glauca]QHR86379.1 hypothetical protein Q903MT_gene378 [Picea sitchensis]
MAPPLRTGPTINGRVFWRKFNLMRRGLDWFPSISILLGHHLRRQYQHHLGRQCLHNQAH